MFSHIVSVTVLNVLPLRSCESKRTEFCMLNINILREMKISG